MENWVAWLCEAFFVKMFERTKHQNWFSVKWILRQPNSLIHFSFLKIAFLENIYFSKNIYFPENILQEPNTAWITNTWGEVCNFLLGLDPRIVTSSWFFSAWLQKLSRMVQIATVFLQSIFDPPFLEGFLRYIPSSRWSWPSICWSCRSLLECLSYLLPSPTFCELQQPRWYYSGVISSLMRSDH